MSLLTAPSSPHPPFPLSHPHFAPFADSEEDDPELLLHVPFDGAVKLTGITVVGGPDGASPSKLKVFINRDDLDFSTVADLPAVQEWELLENAGGQIEYPTQ